jgi:hypothetical protein
MDKNQTLSEILTALHRSRFEAIALNEDFGLRGGWVCCFESDYTPFRQLDDGIIRMFGGKVFVANSAHYADVIRRDLQAAADRTDYKPQIVAVPLTVWAEKRVAILTELADKIEAQAACRSRVTDAIQ